MKKFSPLLAMAIALSGAASAQALNYSTGFEGANPLAGWSTTGTPDWTTTGTPVINTNPTFVRSGTQSLRLDVGNGASFAFSPTEQYGKLTMWVYDQGKTMTDYTQTANGPRWGASDNLSNLFVDQLWNRGYASDTATNYHMSASDTTLAGGGSWSGWGGSGTRIYNAWNKFEFNRPDASTLTLAVNGGTPLVITAGQESAGWIAGDGISGIHLFGGQTDVTSAQIGGIFVDDVSFVAVPEPASLALLGLGAGTLLLGRRRRA